jgi:hypothetical protein
MCAVLFGRWQKSTRRSGRLVRIAHLLTFQTRPLTKNGRDALEKGCLYYPRKQTSVSYAAGCDVIVLLRQRQAHRHRNPQPAAIKRLGPPPSKWSLSLGTTQLWCRNLWRHPALLFDVGRSCRHQSQSRQIRRRLFRDRDANISSLAMRLNKHARDAL